MAYYRINVNLTTKNKINSIADLDFPESTINKLLEMSAISEISTPPLKFMPMWEMRANHLETIGVIFGIELLNSSSQEIASKLNKPVELIDQWKQDLINDLIVEYKKATCGC